MSLAVSGFTGWSAHEGLSTRKTELEDIIINYFKDLNQKL